MTLTCSISIFFFFNDTATTEIYTLSLHDALPIYPGGTTGRPGGRKGDRKAFTGTVCGRSYTPHGGLRRSEEHTSELQSQSNLVCRLLLEKKKPHEQATLRQPVKPIALRHGASVWL